MKIVDNLFSHHCINKTNYTKEDSYIKYNGRFIGELVQVSEKTIHTLIYSERIVNETCALLNYGAGNQGCDIVNSKGESFLRANYAMAKGGHSFAKHASMCIKAQAGNCSGHADVAYYLISKDNVTLPVGRATSDVNDHAFVVIGDPRDNAHETVIVDAWPSLATPFLLKNSERSIINRNPTIKEWLPVGKKPPQNVPIEKIPLRDITHFFKEHDMPEIGNKLSKHLIQDIVTSHSICDHLTTLENPKTSYLSKSSLKRVDTDAIRADIFHSKMAGYKKSLKLRKNHDV